MPRIMKGLGNRLMLSLGKIKIQTISTRCLGSCCLNTIRLKYCTSRHLWAIARTLLPVLHKRLVRLGGTPFCHLAEVRAPVSPLQRHSPVYLPSVATVSPFPLVLCVCFPFCATSWTTDCSCQSEKHPEDAVLMQLITMNFCSHSVIIKNHQSVFLVFEKILQCNLTVEDQNRLLLD